jgi:hypothetical protein
MLVFVIFSIKGTVLQLILKIIQVYLHFPINYKCYTDTDKNKYTKIREKSFLILSPQIRFIAYFNDFAYVKSDSQTSGLVSTTGKFKLVPYTIKDDAINRCG